MRTLRSLLLLAAAAVSSACASSSVQSRNLTSAPPAGSKVVVGKIELADDVAKSISAARADKVEANSDAWLQVMRTSLEGALHDGGVSNGTGGELRIDVRINELDPGSKAARYWVGFGAGTGKVSATVTVGTHGTFTVAGKLSGGWFGGEMDSVMKKLGKDAGVEVARVVKGGAAK